MFRKLFFAAILALLAFPAGQALAQTGTVTGVVTDSTSGEPLPGVNVVIQGTQVGTATGVDGTFTIPSAPAGDQALVATFVGYQRATVPVTVPEGGTVEQNIALAPQVVGLEDVVVTALGIEREAKSLGYSIQEVEGDALEQVPETNFISSLQGQVSGANFFTSNSMGGSTRIVLRGPRSVSGNNEPLIVIDGVVIDNSNLTNANQATGRGGYDYGNAASIINPSDIQSVSLLKGPSAAALYGSRGANGVIEITTKSGRGQQGVGVTINSSIMASSVYGLPDYQNEYGGGGWAPFSTLDGDSYLSGSDDQYVADYATDQSWGPALDGRPVRQWYSWDDVNGLMGQATPWVANPDNVENYFETGTEIQTNVSFAQGGDNFNYRLSLGNLSHADVYPNGQMTRNRVSFNGSLDLTDRLSVTAAANYVDTDARGRPGTGYSNNNPFLQFNHFGQRQVALGSDSYMADYKRTNGNQRGWNWNGISGAQAGRFIYTDNPYWVRYESYQNDATERVYGRVRVAYDLMEGLALTGQAGTDFYTERRQSRAASFSGNGQDGYSESIFDVRESNVQARLSYDTDLTEEFTLSTFGATEYRYETYSNNSGTTQGGLSAPNIFTIENSVARPGVTDYFQEQGVYSVFGSARVGYRDLVFVEATARNDWSSTLPDGENSYFYPSISTSFVFSELEALRESNVLSYGKLRVAWARVGKDTGPYRLQRTYPLGTPIDGVPVQSLPNELPNNSLKPEITSGWEVGTQLDFFGNRLGIDATYYSETSRNQILGVDVSRASGYSSFVVNAGEIANEGVELTVSGTPVLTEDFQWDITANWAKNVNEVVELAEGIESFTLGGAPFGPDVVARVGEPFGAIYGTDFVYDANGNQVMSAAGYYSSSSPQVIGNYQPDWTGSVGTTLSFKGISASVLVNGQMGGDIWSLSNVWGQYSGMYSETVDGNVRELGIIPVGAVYFPDGTPDDPSQAAGTPYESRIDPNQYFSNFYFGPDAMKLYDASYMKLQEVTLGYTLPSNWLERTPLQRLTVSAIGRNLATLYKKTPNFDPSTALSAGNVQGIEAGQVPPTRSYGVSLRIGL